MRTFQANRLVFLVALAALPACGTDGSMPRKAAPAASAPAATSSAGVSASGPSTAGMTAEMAEQLRQAMAASYLKGQWPNSLAILPPPPTCTPGDEEFLRHDESYPSGQTTIGWGGR